MANFFPRWTNWIPLKAVVCVIVIACALTGATWYYATPKYTKIGYQPIQGRIGNRNPIDIDHGMEEPGIGQERRQSRSLYPRMHVRGCNAGYRIRGAHGAPQLRQRIAAGCGAEEQAIGGH